MLTGYYTHTSKNVRRPTIHNPLTQTSLTTPASPPSIATPHPLAASSMNNRCRIQSSMRGLSYLISSSDSPPYVPDSESPLSPVTADYPLASIQPIHGANLFHSGRQLDARNMKRSMNGKLYWMMIQMIPTPSLDKLTQPLVKAREAQNISVDCDPSLEI